MSSIRRRSVVSRLVVAGALAICGAAAWAQDQYPSTTVEVVVPFAAGGAVDVTGRVVAQALSKALNGNFVVINRPGANSNIGNNAVVRAKPDGYTLLVSSIGLAANPSLYKNLSYAPQRDLAPVSLVSNAPVGLFVHKSLPPKTLAEFIAFLK